MTAISEHREGQTTPDEFARFFAPRLQFLLGQLEGHHAIEDEHYFRCLPKPKAGSGTASIFSTATTTSSTMRSSGTPTPPSLPSRPAAEDQDRQRFAAEAYADENARLVAMLKRHLADEEDLIVPLILDRGIGM